MFLPNLNSHFSNRLFLVILSFLLLAALGTRPRGPRSLPDAHSTRPSSVYLRLSHLLRFRA
jgi:hypothetical protein